MRFVSEKNDPGKVCVKNSVFTFLQRLKKFTKRFVLLTSNTYRNVIWSEIKQRL